jgi:hypothetical protein
MKRANVMPFLAALLAGCANEAPLETALDAQGRTEVRATRVLTLARATPRFSEAARDYLYLAPVEVNEMGMRRHYLWLGLATTVDRAWLWAESSEPATLVLVLDGVPIALPLAQWDATEPGFTTAAPTYATLRAQVTLDELERLATTSEIEVQLVSTAGAREPFALWRGEWADWLPFLTGIEPLRAATD